MQTLNLDQINHLNTGLIILSALAAWHLPFEVFLFAYAVLGPLHYFTEISWLHDRQYFSHSKWHSLPLYGIAIALLVSLLISSINLQGMVLSAFAFAALLSLSRSAKLLIPGLVLILLASQWLSQLPLIYLLFSILLPTLIHVCLFTAIFMLLGSLKANSQSGYFSIFIYVVCAIAVFILPESTHYQIKPENFAAAYPFLTLATELNQMLARQANAETLTSAFRFIAFVYTYHYLNWFSKTNILNWHQMPARRAACIVVLWLASVALYYYDYRTGLIVLFFFSMAHVLLEFPLNMQSFGMLYRECSKKLTALRE